MSETHKGYDNLNETEQYFAEENALSLLAIPEEQLPDWAAREELVRRALAG